MPFAKTIPCNLKPDPRAGCGWAKELKWASPSLSPSKGERVPFRAGEGDRQTHSISPVRMVEPGLHYAVAAAAALSAAQAANLDTRTCSLTMTNGVVVGLSNRLCGETLVLGSGPETGWSAQ